MFERLQDPEKVCVVTRDGNLSLYSTSKQNDPVRWIPTTFVGNGEHIGKWRRARGGAPMAVSYEDMRLAFTGQLAKQLVESTLELAIVWEDDADRRGDHREPLSESRSSSDAVQEVFWKKLVDMRATVSTEKTYNTPMSPPSVGYHGNDVGNELVEGAEMQGAQRGQLGSAVRQAFEELYGIIDRAPLSRART